MRQRNTSGSPLHIPDIPALVLHGDEIDWDDPLAGFEPVDIPTDLSPPPEVPAVRDRFVPPLLGDTGEEGDQ